MTTNGSGGQVGTQAYYAQGAVRSTSGDLKTDYTYTGQKLDAGLNLMYYGARYYDTYLQRFLQPDSLMPDWYNPQYLNRYSYVRNNPLRYTDPSGHMVACDAGEECAHGEGALYDLIGQIYDGDASASDRLNQVLDETSGTGELEDHADYLVGKTVHTNFRGLGAVHGSRGFQRQFADDYLYYEMWGGDASPQVGHFLTAVNMSLNGRPRPDFERLVVGHEQISDQAPGAAVRAYRIPTDADMAAFDKAMEDDMSGNAGARDAMLMHIFDEGVHGPQANRVGNSMEDLRLSARGWELGQLVATGQITTNRQLANWIATFIAGH